MRSVLRMFTTGTTPSGLAISSTVLNPVGMAPGLIGAQPDDPVGQIHARRGWTLACASSHRFTARVICRVPGSVSTATCFADSTVTWGRPN